MEEEEVDGLGMSKSERWEAHGPMYEVSMEEVRNGWMTADAVEQRHTLLHRRMWLEAAWDRSHHNARVGVIYCGSNSLFSSATSFEPFPSQFDNYYLGRA
jgi:hypothetical protein